MEFSKFITVFDYTFIFAAPYIFACFICIIIYQDTALSIYLLLSTDVINLTYIFGLLIN